jgi:hypothetical protein
MVSASPWLQGPVFILNFFDELAPDRGAEVLEPAIGSE